MIKYLEVVPEWQTPIRDSGGEIVNKSEVKWSGGNAPPDIGASVDVKMNSLGAAIVAGYFVEDGWLGVTVRLSDPPDWWKRQNEGKLNRLAHIFGAEIRSMKS
jgi:hypothetical protein